MSMSTKVRPTFESLDEAMTGRCSYRMKVGNNTYAWRKGPDVIAIRLHTTDVVSIHRDGTYTLDSGGWRTLTTKSRINEWTPPRVNITQKNYEWTVSGVPFYDGIVVREPSNVTIVDRLNGVPA